MHMSKVIKCPLCDSTEICNVYSAKTYEYIKVDTSGEYEYSYTDNVEDFLHATCDGCGAVFAKNIESMVCEDE